MTALHVGLTLKLITNVNVLLEAGPKQDRIEVSQLLEVVLAIMEEMVVASP